MQKKNSELKAFLGDSTVLIIDPSPNFRDSVRRFLFNLKIKNVKMASSAADVKREIITDKIGFFISEWLLPDQNGLELCRTIRNKKGYETVPFLLMTSENHRSDVILAVEAGVDGYLLKPFSYADFCDQVGDIVKAFKNPSKSNNLLRQADRSLHNKDLKSAEQLYKKALAEKANSARALCGLGRVAKICEDIVTARRYFENAIVSNPDYIEGYNHLLDLYDEIGEKKRHLELAERAHAISPDNPRYTLILAKGYFEHNELTKSEDFFKKTLLLSPKLAEAYKGLGSVFFEQAEYDKAIKNFNKALDLEPGDIAILNSLGMSHVRKGLVVQGIDFYRMALKIDVFDWRVLFNLGFAYEKLGDIDKATGFYQRALAANPKFDKAERRLKSIREAS